MATDMKPLIPEAKRTRELSININDIFLQEGECLGRLECRTGRIGSHDGTIEQRFLLVLGEHPMIITTLTAYKNLRIKGR